LTRKVVSGILYPFNSDKCNAKNSEIPTNIDVYSYMRAHRLASCSVGVIYGGFGVATCNTAVNILKSFGHLRIPGISYTVTS